MLLRTSIGMGLATVLVFAGVAQAHPPSDGAEDDFGSDSFVVGSVTARMGPDNVLVEWNDVVLSSLVSLAVRQAADAGEPGPDGTMEGAGDGVVTEKERDALLAAFRLAVRAASASWAQQDHPSSESFVFIDGAVPKTAQVVRLQTEGITGPVDQEAPVEFSLSIRLGFPDVNDRATSHDVKLSAGESVMPDFGGFPPLGALKDFSVTLRTQSHWSIEADSISPECARDAFADGQFVFDAGNVDCLAQSEGDLLTFRITGTPGFGLGALPAMGLVSYLASMGAATGFLRRRRLG